MKRAAVKVLRVFAGGAKFLHLPPTVNTFPSNEEAVEQLTQTVLSVAVRDRARSRSRSRSKVTYHSSSPEYGRSHSLTGKRIKELLESSSDEDGDSSGSPRHCKSSENRPETSNRGSDSSLPAPPKDVNALVHPVAVVADTAKCYTSSLKTLKYIQGFAMQFQNDMLHEICKNRYLSKIRATTISDHVCGFLNAAKGGSIYFGIRPDTGQVMGIKADRGEKDGFRLGVDRALTNLTPPTLHSLYDVVFSPVVTQQALGTTEMLPICDTYVIEIQIKPIHGTVYTVRDKFFMRQGGETAVLSVQEMHEWTVKTHERPHLEDMRSLQKEVNRLRIELDCAQGD